MAIHVWYYIKFPVKIHRFEVESPNVTNHSLMCNDDIKANTIKVRRESKMLSKAFFLI